MPRPMPSREAMAALGDIDPVHARLFAMRGLTRPEELDYGLARLAPISLLDNIDEAAELVGIDHVAHRLGAGGRVLDAEPGWRLAFVPVDRMRRNVWVDTPPDSATALADADVTAIASGSTPPGPMRLEHDYVVAALGQVQCCRQAGVAAAYDADIGINGTGQGRPGDDAAGGGGVVGSRIFRGHALP